MVDHRRARQSAEQQRAGDQEDAKVSEAIEEGCHQVTLPFNAEHATNGRYQIKICAVGRLQRLAIAGLAIAAMGACGPFCLSGKVTLSNAHVDPSYKCPNPANNLPYVLHASVDVDNSTSNTLTIKSMSEAGTLVDVHGSWNVGSVGQKFNQPIDTFSPNSVKSGDKATIKFTITFSCTSSGPTASTYGDFDFKFTMVTSAGTYTSSTVKYRLVIT